MKKKTVPTTTATTPMLAALEAARPYAERLVFREGILPNSVATHDDCPDGSLTVMAEWQRSQLSKKHQDALEVMGDDLAGVVGAAEDAGYVLGVAVGLLLRLPVSVDGQLTKGGAR